MKNLYLLFLIFSVVSCTSLEENQINYTNNNQVNSTENICSGKDLKEECYFIEINDFRIINDYYSLSFMFTKNKLDSITIMEILNNFAPKVNNILSSYQDINMSQQEKIQLNLEIVEAEYEAEKIARERAMKLVELLNNKYGNFDKEFSENDTWNFIWNLEHTKIKLSSNIIMISIDYSPNKNIIEDQNKI